MKTVVVIPARYASTRFPGKPLHKINGVSMLARTVGAARQAGVRTGARVLVATDDDRIAAHAKEIGVDAVMTDPDLPSGTDRCRAAAELAAPDADFVVNLQGDAPFTPPEHVAALGQLSQSIGIGRQRIVAREIALQVDVDRIGRFPAE